MGWKIRAALQGAIHPLLLQLVGSILFSQVLNDLCIVCYKATGRAGLQYDLVP